MNQKVILMIMDGWGIARDPKVSAIAAAHTPFYDASLQARPHTHLQASEEAVGLPAGQMGNSEVGHMNIGAGRIVYQELVRISLGVREGSIAQQPAWQQMLQHCRATQRPLHLMGLLSDGGVHSHIDHLTGILSLLAATPDAPEVRIHVFTDGRDTSPTGGADYLRTLQDAIRQTGCGRIATVVGRYYAMDRDKNWDRVRLAYDLIVHGKGRDVADPVAALEAGYAAGETDEFVKPMRVLHDGAALPGLAPGDAVLFYNFRTDRGRQLTQALTQQAFPDQEMQPLDLHYTTMTCYDETYKGVAILYDKDNIEEGLGEVISRHGKTQLRIAETEKYPHVTFFFNGGREAPWPGEHRILCPSPKVATYDLQPTMSAFEIRDKAIAALHDLSPDFVCLNFANPDMVGHTGVFQAAVEACATVDTCVQAVTEAGLALGYTVLVTADHGNADCMVNPDGSPHTAHTTALVPLILHSNAATAPGLQPGKLGDLAPTILALMGLPQPAAMTGVSLLHPSPITA